MKLFVVAFFLFIAGALASSCLSFPPSLSKGTACGGAVNCKYGLYCSQTGICETAIAIGSSCNMTSQCVSGSSCKGIVSLMICVARASPGQACSNQPNSTTPDCGSGLVCSGNICLSGKIGDSCGQANNCQSGVCNSVCQPIADYASCSSSNVCKATSYCNGTFFGICLPLQTSGACTTSSQCAFGYFCAGTSATDNNPQCVAYGTRTTGQWCQDASSSSQSYLCQSKRCINGFCAKSAVSVCSSNEDCDYDQFCACDGVTMYAGYGTCQSYPCAKKLQDYYNCTAIACGSASSYSDYSGSCFQTNCASQVNAFNTCSSSSTLQASFFISFAVVFFSIFFSRK